MAFNFEIQEYLAKKAFDYAYSALVASLSKAKTSLTVETEDLEGAIREHLQVAFNWSSDISFSDLRKSKGIDTVFVPLDIYLHPRRYLVVDEKAGVSSLEEVLVNALSVSAVAAVGSSQDLTPPSRHLVILGQPGAGKTTSMKSICHRLLVDEWFLRDVVEFPIVIRLRDLNSRRGFDTQTRLGDNDILISRLQEILGVQLDFPAELKRDDLADQRRSIRDRAVIGYLDKLKVLLILDGFDEISSKARREHVLAEIRSLALQLDTSRIILTSRTGEFGYKIERTEQYELHSLSAEQILTFSRRWLGELDGKNLADRISNSPFADTAMRPLTLAHLCAIFERTGRFPEKPKTVYRKVVDLLIENWDEQRSVKRESAYAHFDVHRKFEFLTNLAYILTTALRTSAFTSMDLENAYKKINENFGLPVAEGRIVARELESHTGLFVQAGFDAYEFSHKSLQEFLGAEFMVRLPSIPHDQTILLALPNELAVATAVSSQPSEYFAELVFRRFAGLDVSFGYIRTFVSRLLLEQPDFERTPRIGIALLALYSQYLGSTISHSTQLSLFMIDDLKREFAQLASAIRDRANLDDLTRWYEIRNRLPGFDGEPILHLVKKQKSRTSGTLQSSSLSVGANDDEYPTNLWLWEALVEVNSFRRNA